VTPTIGALYGGMGKTVTISVNRLPIWDNEVVFLELSTDKPLLITFEPSTINFTRVEGASYSRTFQVFAKPSPLGEIATINYAITADGGAGVDYATPADGTITINTQPTVNQGSWPVDKYSYETFTVDLTINDLVLPTGDSLTLTPYGNDQFTFTPAVLSFADGRVPDVTPYTRTLTVRPLPPPGGRNVAPLPVSINFTIGGSYAPTVASTSIQTVIIKPQAEFDVTCDLSVWIVNQPVNCLVSASKAPDTDVELVIDTKYLNNSIPELLTFTTADYQNKTIQLVNTAHYGAFERGFPIHLAAAVTGTNNNAYAAPFGVIGVTQQHLWFPHHVQDSCLNQRVIPGLKCVIGVNLHVRPYAGWVAGNLSTNSPWITFAPNPYISNPNIPWFNISSDSLPEVGAVSWTFMVIIDDNAPQSFNNTVSLSNVFGTALDNGLVVRPTQGVDDFVSFEIHGRGSITVDDFTGKYVVIPDAQMSGNPFTFNVTASRAPVATVLEIVPKSSVPGVKFDPPYWRCSSIPQPKTDTYPSGQFKVLVDSSTVTSDIITTISFDDHGHHEYPAIASQQLSLVYVAPGPVSSSSSSTGEGISSSSSSSSSSSTGSDVTSSSTADVVSSSSSSSSTGSVDSSSSLSSSTGTTPSTDSSSSVPTPSDSSSSSSSGGVSPTSSSSTGEAASSSSSTGSVDSSSSSSFSTASQSQSQSSSTIPSSSSSISSSTGSFPGTSSSTADVVPSTSSSSSSTGGDVSSSSTGSAPVIPPSVSSVMFSDSLVRLIVTFDRETNAPTGLSSTPVWPRSLSSCNNVLSVTASLGSGISCQWSSAKVLEVLLTG
jgi:hypothetical protein